MHQVERYLFSELLKVGFELLGYFFRQLGTGDQCPQVKLPDGRMLKRLEGMHERRDQSVFVAFVLPRWVYGTREEQVQEYVPLDARLQLPESSFSYRLQDWAQALAVEDFSAKTPTPPSAGGEFIVVRADGNGVPMRKAADQPPIRAHDGHRGPPVDRKKMAILGAVYDAKVHVRTLEQVVDALFGQPVAAKDDDALTPRPKPIAKAVNARLTHTAGEPS